MNRLWAGEDKLGLSLQAKVAGVLILSILLWSFGVPNLLNHAQAATFSLIQDTISSSNPSVLAKHTIVYNNATSTAVGQTIKIGFDEPSSGGTSAFSEVFSTATSTDISFTDNGTPVTVLNTSTCTGAGVAVTGNYNNGTDENITFTVCTTALPAGIINIGIGTSTQLITNPAATASYPITVNGTQLNSGEARVAIIPGVTLTGAVSATFSFSVTGVATSTGFFGNLATTTGSTTATALSFGALVPGTTTILAQQLSVVTNARSGFAVTVQENQPPTSSGGATIDLFKDGASTTIPTAWTAPATQEGVPSSYGHFGVTSDDTDEDFSGGLHPNEFASSTKWAGNIDQPRVVFSSAGAADGTTQNYGKAMVGYRIQIGVLQEAGSDYTNTLTYVATPTF